MLTLSRYLAKYKKEVIIGPTFKLIEAIFELIVPLLMAKIIDVGIKNHDTAYILKYGTVILLLSLTGLFCAAICQYTGSKVSAKVGTKLRDDLFTHLASLPSSTRDKLSKSHINTIMINDTKMIETAVAMLIRLVIRAPFLAIGAIIMAMSLDLKLSLIFIVILPAVTFTFYLLSKKTVPLYKKINQGLDKIALYSKENLRGVRAIHAFNREEHRIQLFNKTADQNLELSIKATKLAALLSPINYLILNGAIVIILYISGTDISVGSLSGGTVIAFINYLSQILIALNIVANLVVLFTKASASASRINDFFKTESDRIPKNTTALPKDSEKTFSFNDLSFSYNQGADSVISHISFSAKKGEKIAIVGKTGSGKSTLLKLLMGIYAPTAGQIRLYDQNIVNYEHKMILNFFSASFQKLNFMTGSIQENLDMSKTVSEKSMIKALKSADAYDFMMEKGGLSALVSKDGSNFSGGQKQRLSMARALCKSANILILDDSFTGLDYLTKKKVFHSICENYHFDNIIFTSQRAEDIKNCEKIIFLNNGMAEGIGTHEDLLASSAKYREICLSKSDLEGGTAI